MDTASFAKPIQFNSRTGGQWIIFLSIGTREGLNELPGGETLPLDPEMAGGFRSRQSEKHGDFFKYSSWLCSEGKNAGIKNTVITIKICLTINL